MKRIYGVGLMAGSLLLAGCEEEPRQPAFEADGVDRTAYEELQVTADTAEAAFEEGGEPVPVTPVQGREGRAGVSPSGALTATGNLRGVGEDAPPGSVTVTGTAEGTRVLVKIDRYASGATLVATLAEGPCDRPGDPVTRIGAPFTIGEEGFATLDARISTDVRAVLDGTHSVRINTPGRGAPEFVLACADLPAAA